MNEKRRQIIESAMKLFAKKGYHAASMQEIADASGVSKGSVYNHFDSKEDLLLSIFRHYYDLLVEKISRVAEDESLSARERLIRQIHVQLREFLRHQNFIEMQMREQAVQVNDEITRFLFKIRAETLEWYKEKVTEVYGEGFRRWAYDLATILNAMINEYIGYLILDKLDLDLDGLSRFIVERLDDLAGGMRDKQPKPMVTEGILARSAKPLEEIRTEIGCIRDLAEGLVQCEDILESLRVLEKEVVSDQPAKVLIQGMLAYLRDIGHPGIRQHVRRLQGMLTLK